MVQFRVIPLVLSPPLSQVQAMKMCGEHPHTVTLHDAKFNASYPKRDGTPEVSSYHDTRKNGPPYVQELLGHTTACRSYLHTDGVQELPGHTTVCRSRDINSYLERRPRPIRPQA